MKIVNDQRLILGPPGTGKTTRCLSIIEQELAGGTAPNRIAYVSFTKKAVEEAVERATTRFNYTAIDLPYFRTLHSLCYRLLRLNRTHVMGRANYLELGQMLGYNFSAKGMAVEDGMPTDACAGDKLLFIDGLARNRLVTLEQQWHDVNDPDIDLFALKRLRDSLQSYKAYNGLYDYTDMLEQAVKERVVVGVDVVVIDEAQDLTCLQWAACRVLFRNAKRVYIAGDDDQCIFRWSGADVEQFLQLAGEREVLGTSYRLPRSVHQLACSVIGRVKHRFDKTWAPRDEVGSVERLPHISSVDFATEGTTLVLARNAYLLNEAEELLRKAGQIYTTRHGDSSINADHYAAIRAWEQLRRGSAISGSSVESVYAHLRVGTGIKRGFKSALDSIDSASAYTMAELRDHCGLIADGIWHDALDGIALNTREYYVSVMRAGAELSAAPRIRISTIHAAKGGEADNVVLLTDMSQRTYRGYQADPDDEQRVFYVGMTRAKKRLTVIDSRNGMGFIAA